MLVIPAIDLKDGMCVRLRRGELDRSDVFGDDPTAMALRWQKAGARRLHIVDLDGASRGEPVHVDAVRDIASRCRNTPLQVGGGIRDEEAARRYLEAGVERVVIGTRAAHDPDFVVALCEKFPGRITVGIDARDGKVAVSAWREQTELEATTLARRLSECGAVELIYTDIGRDGMLSGINIEETAALAEAAPIPVIASGGVRDDEDIRALAKRGGIAGVIVGRALYEGKLRMPDAQRLADSEVSA